MPAFEGMTPRLGRILINNKHQMVIDIEEKGS